MGEAADEAPHRPVSKSLDVFVLIAVLIAGWQGLHWYAGDTAISSPWETVLHLQAQFARPRFWLHLEESLKAFAYALVIAWLGGIGIGV